MNLKQMRRRVWLGATLLAGVVAGGTAGAQIGPSGYVEDAGFALNRHLKELADAPRSLSALLGAAKAALELGDPQAAVTFYARAEAVAPRDGRIKAGIGAAFLAMEQPAPALKFLEEARGLGLPEGAIAADRGLAHDLLGDSAQAQRDYALAMRANDTDEVRRRLALSRAISGDRGGALEAISDQVRRKSPAGWRVRAFVLALTGDAPGATDAARSVIPAQAAAMQPFFARLPQLRPAERAMAVHFGRFPGDAPPGLAPAPLPSYTALPPNVILGGRPDPNQTGLGRPLPAETASTAARRRPGEAEERTQVAARVGVPASPSSLPSRPVQFGIAPNTQVVSTPPPRGQPVTIATAQPQMTVATIGVGQLASNTVVLPARSTPPPAPAVRSGPVQGPPDGSSAPSLIVTTPLPASTPALQANGGTVSLAPPVGQGAPVLAGDVSPPLLGPAPTAGVGSLAAVQPATNEAAPIIATVTPPPPSVALVTAAPTMVTQTAPQPSSLAAAPTTPPSAVESARPGFSIGLASVAATIRALPDGEPVAEPLAVANAGGAPSVVPPAAPQDAPPPPVAETIQLATATVKPPQPAKPAPSRRFWVQLAGKPDEAALRAELQRLKAKVPGLLGDKAGWTAPASATSSRLLVGPFKTQDDAELFVQLLDDDGLRASTWTSAAGQEIVKLAAR